MSRTTRKKKTGSKSVDRSCGNHGSCPYCANGRKYKKKRQEPIEDLTAAADELAKDRA